MRRPVNCGKRREERRHAQADRSEAADSHPLKPSPQSVVLLSSCFSIVRFILCFA